MRLHSHESRQIQAMRGDIIPTDLKIWTDRRRHAIFVVEFQTAQIPPPDYLRKTRNSYLLKFASRYILDSFESASLSEHIRRHIQLMSFEMIDRPMFKGICRSERILHPSSGLQ